MALDADLLRSSFELVVEENPHVVSRFYEILFERHPSVQPLFGRANAAEIQQRMLTEALVAVLDHLDDASWLEDQLAGLGATHLSYGVEDHMYGWVGECLLAAMAEAAGDAWTAEVHEAWAEAYGAITAMCLAGAEAARVAAV